MTHVEYVCGMINSTTDDIKGQVKIIKWVEEKQNKPEPPL